MGASFINQRAAIEKAKALVASMTKATRAERAVARDLGHRGSGINAAGLSAAGEPQRQAQKAPRPRASRAPSSLGPLTPVQRHSDSFYAGATRRTTPRLPQ